MRSRFLARSRRGGFGTTAALLAVLLFATAAASPVRAGAEAPVGTVVGDPDTSETGAAEAGSCLQDGDVRVVVADAETGAELWSAPACVGDEIWYAYVHSADKTPVQSLLRVEEPPVGLVLVLERYLWYGAGLEFRADRGVYPDGRWVVVEADRAVGRLLLRVAGAVVQEVIVGDLRTTLGELAEFGDRVMLEVRP